MFGLMLGALGAVGAPASNDSNYNLLLEDGDDILLEDGSFILLEDAT